MSPLSLGILACLDGYMNIALEQTEEYIGGQVSLLSHYASICVTTQLKNKYGDAFIRGNNGKRLFVKLINVNYELISTVHQYYKDNEKMILINWWEGLSLY